MDPLHTMYIPKHSLVAWDLILRPNDLIHQIHDKLDSSFIHWLLFHFFYTSFVQWSILSTKLTPLYKKGKFEYKLSQWNLLRPQDHHVLQAASANTTQEGFKQPNREKLITLNSNSTCFTNPNNPKCFNWCRNYVIGL